MAIDYASLLSTEQKRSILEQRLNQFALEAYQHDINRKVAVASNNDEGIKNADDALAILKQLGDAKEKGDSYRDGAPKYKVV